MSQQNDTTITDRIAEIEAQPIAARCAAMHTLWCATRHGLDAERAVGAAVIRALPDAEAMPIAERCAALHALWWATRHGSDARRAAEAALDAAESA